LVWDPNQGSGSYFDFVAAAFMLGANKKLPQDDFLVFYNNLESPDGALKHFGDDEALTVNLSKVDSRIREIIFIVTIHDYEARKQNFGQVRNSFIRIYNAQTNEEIAKYDLEEDFSMETAVEFGRLYRKDGQWKFEAMGSGYSGGLQFFVSKYT